MVKQISQLISAFPGNNQSGLETSKINKAYNHNSIFSIFLYFILNLVQSQYYRNETISFLNITKIIIIIKHNHFSLSLSTVCLSLFHTRWLQAEAYITNVVRIHQLPSNAPVKVMSQCGGGKGLGRWEKRPPLCHHTDWCFRQKGCFHTSIFTVNTY